MKKFKQFDFSLWINCATTPDSYITDLITALFFHFTCPSKVQILFWSTSHLYCDKKNDFNRKLKKFAYRREYADPMNV